MLCTIKNPIKYQGKRRREGVVDLDEASASILIARGDVEPVQADQPDPVVSAETVTAPAENAEASQPEGVVTVETEIVANAKAESLPEIMGKKTRKGGKAKE